MCFIYGGISAFRTGDLFKFSAPTGVVGWTGFASGKLSMIGDVIDFANAEDNDDRKSAGASFLLDSLGLWVPAAGLASLAAAGTKVGMASHFEVEALDYTYNANAIICYKYKQAIDKLVHRIEAATKRQRELEDTLHQLMISDMY